MAVTDTWLLSTVVSLPTPPTPPSIISILLYKDFFKQPAWMTACKIKLWYMMLKKGSYYFKCLKYIYLFQEYLESQKMRILHPPLVLPVNLWHDSWTKRAAISAYLKPPLLPEAQFYSLYFSKRKYAWNSSVLQYTAEITRCFFFFTVPAVFPLPCAAIQRHWASFHIRVSKKTPQCSKTFSPGAISSVFLRNWLSVFLLPETAAISANPPSSQITHSENIPHFLSQKTCSGYHSTG